METIKVKSLNIWKLTPRYEPADFDCYTNICYNDVVSQDKGCAGSWIQFGIPDRACISLIEGVNISVPVIEFYKFNEIFEIFADMTIDAYLEIKCGKVQIRDMEYAAKHENARRVRRILRLEKQLLNERHAYNKTYQTFKRQGTAIANTEDELFEQKERQERFEPTEYGGE